MYNMAYYISFLASVNASEEAGQQAEDQYFLVSMFFS